VNTAGGGSRSGAAGAGPGAPHDSLLAAQPDVADPTDERLTALATELAATRRGTLGQPRAFAVATDGRRVCFLRATGPADARQGLWCWDGDGEARLLVDPDRLGDEGDLDDVERARRERTREQATGITAFAGTPNLDVVTFAYSGQIHVVTPGDGQHRGLRLEGPVVDPRPSPTGTHVAWVADGALHAAAIDGTGARVLARDSDPDVTWGLAEFIAAEEMGRLRGYWWAPDGASLAVCRVDVSDVRRWWLHEPSAPETAPAMLRYPAAGTANADVRLVVVDLDGSHRTVAWDTDAMPYLAAVDWSAEHPLTFAVQRRDQQQVDVLVDDDGGTRVVRTLTAEPWVALVDGVPGWTRDGRLVTVEDDPLTDTRHLVVEGEQRSPTRLTVDAVLAIRDHDVVIEGSADDATATVLWSVPIDEGPTRPLSPITGVHHGVVGGDTMVVTSHRGHDVSVDIAVHRDGASGGLAHVPVELPLQPQPILTTLSARRLHAALLLPTWYRDGALPVLLDPYGGPHARRVVQAARSYLTSQWFAEAGFAVLVIDGRGTPGRGLTWEHAVAGDLATPALEDQVLGLQAAAEQWEMLDPQRVAIRGWSFGGFLAALAVLRRPDVFHAAIAGAPVTDWRLYDTHYTERYLGDPADAAVAYERSSLLADAPALRRPLMLLHGLADDNVVAAHSLRLSQELLLAGRPHTVLPLPNTTHVTRDPRQEARLLSVQLAFLRDALGS
jgi:dipeptidyl-peptidase-4